MKVAFNIYPLHSGHKTRGVGLYTTSLLQTIKKEGIEVQEFKDISEVKDAEVVHYPWFDLFFRSLKLNKIPTVVTVHDVMPLIFPKEHPLGIRAKVNLFLQTLSLKKAKRIVTISQTSKEDIIKYLKINESKIVVIPEAAGHQFKQLNSSSLLELKRRHQLPDRFLLYVGDANFVKNLPFLIEGFKKLKEDRTFSDVKLVLVGGAFLKKVEDIDHPELESLKKVNRLIREFNLESEIFRPGQVSEEDLVKFYNLATVYIQPSLYEGFGLPILEAFKCGTPVICSQTSSLNEVGRDVPIYFDPNDQDQFIRVLSDFLQDKSLQEELSKKGLKRAEDFSWEKTAKETIKVYEELV